MRNLTSNETKIVGELIKNPRISDNQIAKNTGVAVMTVNRNRKALEEEGIINYYTTIKKHRDGLNIFNVRQLYIIKLRAGITRLNYIEKVEMNEKLKIFNSTYISSTFLGEKDGHLAIILTLDAVSDSKLIDEFNGKVIKEIESQFGEDAIKEIVTCRINDTVRLHHNYLPDLNMKKGVIKKDWPNEFIFIDKDKRK